jgi:hypothetical protein
MRSRRFRSASETSPRHMFQAGSNSIFNSGPLKRHRLQGRI